jgi:opacity protein-like surface antigen
LVRITAITLAVALGLAVRAEAQRPIELGVDGTIARVTSDGGDFTTIAVPLGRVRAGFYLSDAVSLEPSLGFSWVDTDDASATSLTLGAGLLYHFKADPAVVRPFIEGNVQMAYEKVSVDDLDIDESDTQFAIGGGVGVKIPMVSRMDLRLEAFVQHAFESDAALSSMTFGALFGFSFYTR